jgi:hypothetical protein
MLYRPANSLASQTGDSYNSNRGDDSMGKRKGASRGDAGQGAQIDINAMRQKYFADDAEEGGAIAGDAVAGGEGADVLSVHGFDAPSESLRQVILRDMPEMEVLGPEQVMAAAHDRPDAVSVSLTEMRRAALGATAGYDAAQAPDEDARHGATAGGSGPSGIVVVTPRSSTDDPQIKLQKAKAVVVVDGQIIAHQG